MFKTVCRWIIAVFFIVAGANHFRDPATYQAMIPPALPWPTGLNPISGAAEMLGGFGLMVASWRRFAGMGLILLLLAVFPANIYVALQGRMAGFNLSPLTLWLRLPFQIVFIAWVWWVALARPQSRPIH